VLFHIQPLIAEPDAVDAGNVVQGMLGLVWRAADETKRWDDAAKKREDELSKACLQRVDQTTLAAWAVDDDEDEPEIPVLQLEAAERLPGLGSEDPRGRREAAPAAHER